MGEQISTPRACRRGLRVERRSCKILAKDAASPDIERLTFFSFEWYNHYSKHGIRNHNNGECTMKKLLVLAAVLLTVARPAWAVDRWVPTQYPTIQAAVDAAQSGDNVMVSPGVYSDVVHTPPGDTTRCVVVMKSGITLRGAGMNYTVIDANSLGRGIYCSGVSNASIENLTIRESLAGGVGGAILCRENSTPTISHCEVTANGDGGIVCKDSSPTITGCFITNNTGKDGAAISMEASTLGLGSSPQVTNCTMTGNTAPSGGGLFINGSTSHPIFTNCLVGNNSISTPTGNGGGINISGSNLTMNHCWIVNNTAHGTGGGMFEENSVMDLTDCWIVGNNAISTDYSPGGGMLLGYQSVITMTDCVIAHNAIVDNVWSEGAGICAAACTSLTIRQCTIARNTNPSTLGGGIALIGVDALIDKSVLAFNGPGEGMYCSGSLPTVSCSDLFGNQGGDLICGLDGGNNFSQDPRFCDMTHDDYRLQSDSPCLAGHHPNGAGVCNGSRLGGEDQGCAPIDVDDPSHGFASTRLLGNEPNPFTSSTEIRYELARTGPVTLRICDVTGRVVRTLQNGPQAAGSQRVIWDGKTDQGQAAASGIYFYTLRTPGSGEARRMILAR
jgi:hypothetical protein